MTRRRADGERQPQWRTRVILLASFTIRFGHGATSETGSPKSVPERARGAQDHSGFPPHRAAWETWSIFTCLQKDKVGAGFGGHSASPAHRRRAEGGAVSERKTRPRKEKTAACET